MAKFRAVRGAVIAFAMAAAVLAAPLPAEAVPAAPVAPVMVVTAQESQQSWPCRWWPYLSYLCLQG